MVSKNKYDVVLMDIQMPIMDGFEATIKIREMEVGSKKHVPIIALTAHAFEEDKNKCIEAGMDDYVAKPIDYNVLFSKLNSFIAVEKSEETKNEQNSNIDLSEMLKAINNNQDVFNKLTKYFIVNYPAQLKELFSSVESKDYPKIARDAHTLKASVGNFGAKRAFELIRSLEIMAKEKTIEDPERIITDIKKELESVEIYLKSYNITEAQSNKNDKENSK